jgi:alpha-tubulin suppressor-like RCC1 family protein
MVIVIMMMICLQTLTLTLTLILMTAQNQAKDIKKQQNDPILIQGLSNVAEIACGSAFNLALCDDGSVYSWGLGES